MVRAGNERILVIGDAQRELRGALAQAAPAAQVVHASSIFEGIAELTGNSFSAVLASAEPIERRPESAVRALRELAGTGRVLLFGHPTLEPLSRKMLEFGADDYLVTPASAADLEHILRAPLRLTGAAPVPAEQSPAIEEPESPILETEFAPAVAATDIPLADIMLDAMVLSPQDAMTVALAQINAKLAPAMSLSFRKIGDALSADEAQLLSAPVLSGTAECGRLLLSLSSNADQVAGRHLLAHVAQLSGKLLALKDRHVKLQRLAITDDLTGLFNARYFHHFLTQILDKARVLMFPVTLVSFDIDNFKKYNDQYGHGVGDEVLKQTAALMRRCVRDHDMVARIGGDEFVVVFWEKEGPRQPRDPHAGTPGRPRQTPVQILDRFRRLLATQNFTTLGATGQGSLTISGGLAVFPYHAQTAQELKEAADKALMFKAKQSGKNNIYLVGGGSVGDAETGPV